METLERRWLVCVCVWSNSASLWSAANCRLRSVSLSPLSSEVGWRVGSSLRCTKQRMDWSLVRVIQWRTGFSASLSTFLSVSLRMECSESIILIITNISEITSLVRERFPSSDIKLHTVHFFLLQMRNILLNSRSAFLIAIRCRNSSGKWNTRWFPMFGCWLIASRGLGMRSSVMWQCMDWMWYWFCAVGDISSLPWPGPSSSRSEFRLSDSGAWPLTQSSSSTKTLSPITDGSTLGISTSDTTWSTTTSPTCLRGICPRYERPLRCKILYESLD